MIKYYLAETSEGIFPIKTKTNIRNRKMASAILQRSVSWVFPSNIFVYYFYKIKEFFSHKN